MAYKTVSLSVHVHTSGVVGTQMARAIHSRQGGEDIKRPTDTGCFWGVTLPEMFLLAFSVKRCFSMLQEWGIYWIGQSENFTVCRGQSDINKYSVETRFYILSGNKLAKVAIRVWA